MARNVQKYIDEYVRRFCNKNKNKQYATFSSKEWADVVESGRINGKLSIAEVSANAMYFGFMVGYKAALHEMKLKEQKRSNANKHIA